MERIDGSDPGSDLIISCDSCRADRTSACIDCVVTHLLANDGGPIALVPALVRRPTRCIRADDPTERVIGWFVAAGLVADPPDFVSAEEFAGASAIAGWSPIR